MVIKEYYKTRTDGVKLFKSYSNEGFYIHKIGTDEVYSEAIDVENAPYEYDETDKIKPYESEEIIEEEKEQNNGIEND